MSKHYDVVVLGASVGALTAAALLARRSWRVLVLGQGYRKPTYTWDGLVFARRPFTFLSASSPAFRRVLVELAQSQTFRRRLVPLDPMFQILAKGVRLDLPPDTQLFAREIDREFPAVRRVVDDLYTELARANAAADAAFEKDAVWPPGGFWERRETERIVATLPWIESANGAPPADILAELTKGHPFRDVVTTPARFASDLAGELPTFSLARLHGAWTRGVSELAAGEDELIDFLLDRVRAHGGETNLTDRATELAHRAGKVRGVHVDGDAATGVTFVVSDLPEEETLELARGFVPARDGRPRLETAENRFVMSMVVRPEGLPTPLAHESFLLGDPTVHLQIAKGAAKGTVMLVAETLLPANVPLAHAREEVLATILENLTFLERHIIACDSPHDGRPLWDFRNPTQEDAFIGDPALGLRAHLVDRAKLRMTGGSIEPEPMAPRFRVYPDQLHGLAGEPLRTALGNVFSTGRSVLSALGQEGELLAAWGVARVITRTDRRKEKMLREMWSKVELS